MCTLLYLPSLHKYSDCDIHVVCGNNLFILIAVKYSLL